MKFIAHSLIKDLITFFFSDYYFRFSMMIGIRQMLLFGSDDRPGWRTSRKSLVAQCEPSDLGEVPPLDEVSRHVSSCFPMNHWGDVVPRHSGSCVSVYEVYDGRGKWAGCQVKCVIPVSTSRWTYRRTVCPAESSPCTRSCSSPFRARSACFRTILRPPYADCELSCFLKHARTRKWKPGVN